MSETRSTILQVDGGLKLAFQNTRLVVRSGPDRGAEVLLLDGPVVIGRGENTDLRLSDETVSRRHFRVIPRGEGWELEDLESKAGTSIDGTPVKSAPITHQSKIRAGDTELALVTSQAEIALETHEREEFEGLLGTSKVMRELFGMIRKVGALHLPVLLHGESGTGKESLARALHTYSQVSDGPYEVIDCTLLHSEHLRSELFGHVKGAFTGAEQSRQGVFERANGGTVFLDEIGELPLEFQAALLRVLEEGEVRPLGGSHVVSVRTRVVSASNRDLRKMVEEGSFRQDLYYRLGAITLDVPPLRERVGDALLLTRHLLPSELTLADEARSALERYAWPGNVRELRNALQRGAALAEGGVVTVRDLGIDRELSAASISSTESAKGVGPAADGHPGGEALTDHMQDEERRAILEALKSCGGSRKATAEHLGLPRSTFYYKLKKLGIT